MNERIDLPQAREVCPTTTRRLIGEGALLVDVRERNEVAQLAFDVPDLVVMPLSEFERRCGELPRDRELVLVCESGPRSLKATYFLMYRGYTRVVNMEGGIVKWAAKGLPVKGARAAVPGAAGGCCGDGAAASSCCRTTAAAVPAASCCRPTATTAAKCC